MTLTLRAVALVVSVVGAASSRADEPAAAAPEWPPRLAAVRVSVAPSIDGRLDDQAWQTPPLPLGEWITYNPAYGEKLAQKTEVWAAYDDKNLYFAFRCRDPEPDKVRANLSRRDQLFNDDWVGLSLDSLSSGQSSYDMFVNARGVQGDILTSSSAGEQLAPDWVWDSAGRTTPEGYDIEIRLPLKSIRFKSGREVPMGVMFWRRVSRLGQSASWPDIQPGRSFIERHATLVLHDLKAPLTLEVIPSVTYSSNQLRETPDRFGPRDSEPDAGLSLKYGVTSSVTLEGTVNPDFSQVESDAFQVEVNQRFPLFFSEKRPFFMEGMGTFEMAGAGGDAVMRTAVHTRRIVDPLWGGKLTGQLGRVTFATLSASDEAPGRPFDGEVNPHLGRDQAFHIARALYGLGKNRYVGAILTDTEFASGHNRVAGGDVSLQFGNHKTSATVLASQSRAADGTNSRSGLGGQASYVYETKRWVFVNQAEHYDTDFQMDTAFLNQTGVTANWSFAALSLYPDAKKHPWLKRVVPFVFSRFVDDQVQGGTLKFVLPGVRMHFTRQGFFRVDGGWGEEPWRQRLFPIRFVRVMGGAQFTKWLNVFVNTHVGRSLLYDDEDPFSGNVRNYSLDAGFQPSSSFNQSIGYNRAELDRLDGSSVYRVNVLNTRTTYQFNKQFFLRGIVQWDSSRKRVLTDLLGSFELLPGTVAYLGYGSLIEERQWDGTRLLEAPGDYLTTRRGFFFKASYIHRF
ncbi:MAG TPA: DUF5916 domain-containing protein [Vicinamibacteria bacterium]|nr:DUF5916 domain-containing protein [Vicinamibacteria bacterium]